MATVSLEGVALDMTKMAMEAATHSVTPSSMVPFQELPNLPKALIPQIDLGIERVDVESLALALAEDDNAISSKRRVGFYLADNYTQTEESNLLDLKQTTSIIQTLVQDVGQLRKDFNFAQHMLKADYESRLMERATELYCQSVARFAELERRHKDKVEIVRKSHRTQLNNAIQKIAGEYQAYHDELMEGKTGRTDAKIRRLKEKIELQEQQLEQGKEKIAKLTQHVEQYEEKLSQKALETPPPAAPPGISLEKAEELRGSVERLEEELVELRTELAASEDSNNKLARQLESAHRQLEDERSKVSQLRRDMEAQKKKAKSELDIATRLANDQMAALEKEWKDKAESAEKEAARKAQEEAELYRIQEQAKFQEELSRHKNLEEELKLLANQCQTTPPPAPIPSDLESEVKRLRKIEEKQRMEIERLGVELERANRVWEMKLTIMQRNFHALRDELYVRHSLQRQAASLHHASVGYASHGHKTKQNHKPLPKIKNDKCKELELRSTLTSGATSDSPVDVPLVPSSTPQHKARQIEALRTVHFDPPLQT